MSPQSSSLSAGAVWYEAFTAGGAGPLDGAGNEEGGAGAAGGAGGAGGCCRKMVVTSACRDSARTRKLWHVLSRTEQIR